VERHTPAERIEFCKDRKRASRWQTSHV